MEKSNRQNGFTLIEVMIAMLLLTIGILAAGTMQISSLDGNSRANRLTQASTWAGDKIEALMSRSYDDSLLKEVNTAGSAGLNCTDTTGTPACLADHTQPSTNGFTVFWNVADDFPIKDSKTIRVIVRRSDRNTTKTVAVDYIKMRLP